MALGATTTLWKHAGAELLRLVALTSAVLVVIIAFASSVRWIANGALGPVEMVKFVSLAIVPMLAYALPFAAGFAATLTFHRMASDNEVTAAHAGGVGHSKVLVPALAVGLLLAGSLALLNDQVIPRFLRNMEQLITTDLTKVMTNTIKHGDSLKLGDYLVTADDVIRMDPKADPVVAESGATDWLVMLSFMAVQQDEQGRVIGEATAREAQLFFFPHPSESAGAALPGAAEASNRGSVLLLLFDAVAMTDGRLARFDKTSLPPIDVPMSFADDPKFLTSGELRALRAHPERMNFIETRRRDVANGLARSEIAARLESAFDRSGAIELESPSGPVTVRGRGLTWLPADNCWRIEPTDTAAPVEALAPDPSRPGADLLRRAERATLHLDTDAGPAGGGLAVRLELYNVTTAGGDALSSGDRRRLIYDQLALPDDPLERLLAKPSKDLLAIDRAQHNGELSPAGKELVYRIAKLEREITSKQHERAAMAVSCFVMTLCGAVVALRLRDALPLTVYLWSFFPALACVISISSGQQFVHDAGIAALPVLWGGVLALAAYTLYAYRAVARH